MSLDYTLAKELKDAGFPQDGRNHIYLYEGTFAGNNFETRSYVPTLPELIEACGDDYFTLSGIGSDWLAVYGANPKFEERGKSMIEAVARLWLALHTTGK